MDMVPAVTAADRLTSRVSPTTGANNPFPGNCITMGGWCATDAAIGSQIVKASPRGPVVEPLKVIVSAPAAASPASTWIIIPCRQKRLVVAGVHNVPVAAAVNAPLLNTVGVLKYSGTPERETIDCDGIV